MNVYNIKNSYQNNNMIVQKQADSQEKEVTKEQKQEKTNVESNQQEKVTISKAAMDKLQNQENSQIRQDKVEELKQKIASGEFQVNSSKVADKLIQQYQKTSLL